MLVSEDQLHNLQRPVKNKMWDPCLKLLRLLKGQHQCIKPGIGVQVSKPHLPMYLGVQLGRPRTWMGHRARGPLLSPPLTLQLKLCFLVCPAPFLHLSLPPHWEQASVSSPGSGSDKEEGRYPKALPVQGRRCRLQKGELGILEDKFQYLGVWLLALILLCLLREDAAPS